MDFFLVYLQQVGSMYDCWITGRPYLQPAETWHDMALFPLIVSLDTCGRGVEDSAEKNLKPLWKETIDCAL